MNNNFIYFLYLYFTIYYDNFDTFRPLTTCFLKVKAIKQTTVTEVITDL